MLAGRWALLDDVGCSFVDYHEWEPLVLSDWITRALSRDLAASWAIGAGHDGSWWAGTERKIDSLVPSWIYFNLNFKSQDAVGRPPATAGVSRLKM